MKIVADENIPGLSCFEAHGELMVLPGRDINASHLKHAKALITRSVTRVSDELLKGSSVEFVGSCTIGEDHLDRQACERNGVHLVNAPGSNANSVAEYVLACLLALDRSPQKQTVAIIGYGNVGKRLAALLSALDYPCCTYDPFIPDAEMHNPVNFDEALQCDVVSLHTPLTRDGRFPTWHLIDEVAIRRMKPGSLLLNTGRGAVVDNRALLDILKKAPDSSPQVVLDVWEHEPRIDTGLLEKVSIATPHIAGYSHEGKMAATRKVYHDFCAHFGFQPQQIATADDEPIILEKARDVDQVVLSVFDPLKDDRCMREALLDVGLSAQELAKRFDDLRKHYWARREFSHFRLSAHTPDSVKSSLLSLGFLQ